MLFRLFKASNKKSWVPIILKVILNVMLDSHYLHTGNADFGKVRLALVMIRGKSRRVHLVFGLVVSVSLAVEDPALLVDSPGISVALHVVPARFPSSLKVLRVFPQLSLDLVVLLLPLLLDKVRRYVSTSVPYRPVQCTVVIVVLTIDIPLAIVIVWRIAWKWRKLLIARKLWCEKLSNCKKKKK